MFLNSAWHMVVRRESVLKTAHGVVCVGDVARNQIKRRSIRRVGNFSSIAKQRGVLYKLGYGVALMKI